MTNLGPGLSLFSEVASRKRGDSQGRFESPVPEGMVASFPADLWPAEEEETGDGIYLRLKDGTRLVGEESSWRRNRNVAG